MIRAKDATITAFPNLTGRAQPDFAGMLRCFPSSLTEGADNAEHADSCSTPTTAAGKRKQWSSKLQRGFYGFKCAMHLMALPTVPNALLLNKSKPADDVIPALSAEDRADFDGLLQLTMCRN